jgi:hypothetical protein
MNKRQKGEVIMKKTMSYFVAMVLIIGSVSSNLRAADTSHEGHGKTDMSAPSAMESASPAGTFKHEVVDKHIRAEFQIMSLASMNMKDPNGDTHHVMVKLFHDSMNHPIKNAVGKVKIIKPDGKEQTNSLKNYNGIFAANFTFGEKGKYGVICLVIVDGEKHIFKFWYPHG